MLPSTRLLTVAAALAVTGCTYIGATAPRTYGGSTATGVIAQAAAVQQAELNQTLAGSGARITNTGSQLRVILPEAAAFAPGSTTVNAGFMPSLREIARSLIAHPNSTVRVVGHTDNQVAEAYNRQISQERALAVARVLIRYGVSSTRISYSGRGSAEPITSNASTAGRATNQRVEVVITPTN
ncbi:OmpA family protein [Rhodobacter sp. Har01]|uniref:OmpA family protein n=1 Tax=Rhodobacter sp. Har01 TaxID=2883999 RepID=UPI001D05C798|nr:OmpA family protein [Rhodobacter sp. Har01]MCB6179060.1 OmpA family protein [Rhodobacter sp. Har01]